MTNDFASFTTKYITLLQDEMDSILTPSTLEKMEEALEAITKCNREGGTVWLIGNGGSASLASHMATDLQLAGVKAIALTDVANITTQGNDDGFEYIFSNQLETLGRKGDIVIAISGSGESINIIYAITKAQYMEIYSIGVVGFNGGDMVLSVNSYWKPSLLLHFPSPHMGRSQDGHQIILHVLCYWLMELKKGKI